MSTFRLGTIIRRWRLSHDLSVRDVAKEIGIAPSTLVHMEQGKCPPNSSTLIAVFTWLMGVSDADGQAERGSASAGQESGGQINAAG